MNDKMDLIIAIAAATIVMALLTVFIIYFIVAYRKKQRAFQWEREAFKQSLLQTEIEIKEQTLSDISRELHDNFGQIASLIKINLNLALAEIPSVKSGKITESLSLLKQLIQDIKSLSVSLKAENLARFGLIEMIKKDLERYQKIGDWAIDFKDSENLPTLEGATEIFLYRMSQEIFNNILKHASASVVKVDVTYENDVFELKIMDNGIGFDPTIKNTGSGMINLKERADLIQAKLIIETKKTQGTTVIIQKPI
jgi:signal transduction histidine kinase